ncbi:MAG: hypothetical protein OEZ57_05345 [Nitrospirota bacterium]|nr:hypothetical protein [Nitrospirota bacterium]
MSNAVRVCLVRSLVRTDNDQSDHQIVARNDKDQLLNSYGVVWATRVPVLCAEASLRKHGPNVIYRL